MTGRDIWSTTPHCRPLSGVTWKMSWWGQGDLVTGCQSRIYVTHLDSNGLFMGMSLEALLPHLTH